MNWIELKEKYPKAHKLALIYTLEHNFDHLTKRWLYDFFDENGINILITCEFDFGYDILGSDRCDIIMDNIEESEYNNGELRKMVKELEEENKRLKDLNKDTFFFGYALHKTIDLSLPMTPLFYYHKWLKENEL